MDRRQRSFLVPEVLQISTMDCGPAILASVLAGFRLPSSYGRLRELCQTDVDGTSIETLEEVLNQLSLEAEQVMVPPEFLLQDGGRRARGKGDEGRLLPAIAVVTQPDGAFHFIVIWRRLGNYFQIMDPARGRRWVRAETLQRELYLHNQQVPGEAWAQWSASAEFLAPIEARLRRLRVPANEIRGLLAEAREAPEPAKTGVAPAALEAALRSTESLHRSGALARGRSAAAVLQALYRRAREDWERDGGALPPSSWSVQPAQDASLVVLRGCVLVKVRRQQVEDPSPAAVSDTAPQAQESRDEAPQAQDEAPQARQRWAAVQQRPEPSPERQLFALLQRKHRGILAPVLGSLTLGALAVACEALLFTALIGLGGQLSSTLEQSLLLALVALLIATFGGVHWLNLSALLRLGRHLEAQLRQAFLRKLPRLGVSFFNSRLRSDMAERGHNAYALRELPRVLGSGVTSASELLFTVLALAWMYPGVALPAAGCAMLAVLLPWAFQPLLAERDLRLRTLSGTLSRFFLDTFLGLVPIRAHGAERVIERQHDSVLDRWTEAGLRLQRVALGAGLLQSGLSTGFAALLVFLHVQQSGTAGLLLLAYWALRLPSLGTEIASAFERYPLYRSLALRLLEPLGAPDEDQDLSSEASDTSRSEGSPSLSSDGEASQPSAVGLELRGVHLEISGHPLLQDIDLSIAAGEHVAVLGASGAGKSTLLGLLLGWHRPSRGEIQVDGRDLQGDALRHLRQRTAWIDPAVQLWNRSLSANLRYGQEAPPAPEASPGQQRNSSDEPGASPGELLEEAELYELVEKLPQGLTTSLGEGGSLISGGEGQRVRFGRGAGRPHARLALLDEAFRGLDAETRGRLLARARRRFQHATLLVALHSPQEAKSFDRVLFLADGRLVESGSPEELLADPDSAYRRALEAEEALHRRGWRSAQWRHWELRDGRVEERVSSEGEESASGDLR
ncbi:MAG: ATP-binding cassette domain-containing protein [Acidobacteriota bacterium]